MEPSALIVRWASSLLTASRKGTHQKKKGFLCSDGEEVKRGSSSSGKQVVLGASKRQTVQGVGTGKGFSNASQSFQCYSRNYLYFSLLAFSKHGVAWARGANRAGRKESAQGICIASCVIEKPWSSRDRRCKQQNRGTSVLAFARAMLGASSSPWERVTVCASVFCLLLETQIRLADMLSMHQGTSLQKHCILGPEHFKLRTHILRKLWQFQHCSWLFVH